ncbi:MAG: hypothetical protein Q4E54_08190 [Lachnospiraceae bacterium]|nr:hypothetical protein [Lachnospiraceae bacterium]
MISFRTDIKQNKNAKAGKLKTLILLNLCLALLCAAAFGTSAFVVRANAANYETERAVNSEWFLIEDEGRTLTIHLDGNIRGYEWKYGLSNSNLRELRFMETSPEQKKEDKKYDWSTHLTSYPDITGDITVTLQYVQNQDSKSIDTRMIPLHIEKGIITKL